MHHSSAIIDPSANIDESVDIGPFSVIGPNVTIGKDTKIESHVILKGPTTIGERNHVFQFSTVGDGSPDKKYKNEPTLLTIGDDNIIREGVTIHRGTIQDKGETLIGNRNLIMAYSHIAHDCVVGNNVIMINESLIGGHVTLGDYVYIGANSGVKQWMRIGKHAMVSSMTGVMGDIIPYGNVFGTRGELVGLNLIGLKRRGFDKDKITTIRRAYRMLFAMEGTFIERLEEVKRLYGDIDLVAEMLQFIDDGGDNPLCHASKG